MARKGRRIVATGDSRPQDADACAAIVSLTAGMRCALRADMSSAKQSSAAKKNIKKAAAAAKRKKTLKKLPKATRTALGKQANKVKRQRGG